MTVPELGADDNFFVRMEDDDGNTHDTPGFKLQVSSDPSSPSSASSPDSGSSSGSFATGSPSDSSSRDASGSVASSPGSSNDDQNKAQMGSNDHNNTTSSKTATGSKASGALTANVSASNFSAFASATGSILSGTLGPSATNKALISTAADNKPSTVAIVVPLAIFAAALAGLIFSLRQRSRTKKELEKRNKSAHDEPALQRSISNDSAGGKSDTSSGTSQMSDLERAMQLIAKVQTPKSPSLTPLPPSLQSRRQERAEKRGPQSGEISSIGSVTVLSAKSGDSNSDRGVWPNPIPPVVNGHQIPQGYHYQPGFSGVDPYTGAPYPGQYHVHPGYATYGPAHYQLPSIPRIEPLADPSSYVPPPGVGPHPSPPPVAHSISSIQEPTEPRMNMPNIRIPRPPGLTQPVSIPPPRTYQYQEPVPIPRLAPAPATQFPVDRALSFESPPATQSNLGPPPVLPASLRVAQPQETSPPAPEVHDHYPQVNVAQPLPNINKPLPSPAGPDIPYSTRPSSASLASNADELGSIPNPYDAIAMALRAE
ncbi:hypothetical protein BDV93DRAFT_5791 [Ceratobasidium sp. AG-I]|nr:hypothetical protein BDV93DRAFT_5791 [Ceratobasidium sp. AG-I]